MKHFIVCSLVLAYCLTRCGSISAQENNGNFPADKPEPHLLYTKSLHRIGTYSENGKPVYLNDISTKAVADFKTRFKDVDNEQWRKLPHGGYVAAFQQNDISYIIWYTAKGKWQSMLKRYKEPLLPFEVRDLVKRTYYDYSIFQVNEITTTHNPNKPAYVVYIQFNSLIKMIRVKEEEMEVLQELTTQ